MPLPVEAGLLFTVVEVSLRDVPVCPVAWVPSVLRDWPETSLPPALRPSPVCTDAGVPADLRPSLLRTVDSLPDDLLPAAAGLLLSLPEAAAGRPEPLRVPWVLA